MALRCHTAHMNRPSPAENDRFTVVDQPGRNRYELLLDEDVVGFANYMINDQVLTVPHVETVPQHRGKDFAARLMHGVLDDVRKRSLTIRPLCGYADAYMRRHPENNDLRA